MTNRAEEPQRDRDPVAARLIEQCHQQRESIETVKGEVSAIMTGYEGPTGTEAMANVLLAFRHLEDARMRLGKAIQALDGGTSCYPR